ncbi:hypothetical protein HYV49_03810 [Candidatus Pacearchaeota archaeon]|nr:hypothetical protein [Candidatus Pacearchaeota archaeon]
MNVIFEIIDKSNRKTRLTKERWAHIRTEHSNIENPEEIIETLQKPDEIIYYEREGVEYSFKYFKHKKWKSKFLKVVVKYINNEGSILSAHFVRNIK